MSAGTWGKRPCFAMSISPLRGLRRAHTEISLAAMAYNLKHMVNVLGARPPHPETPPRLEQNSTLKRATNKNAPVWERSCSSG